jgi:hypothetical protein
MFYGASFTYNGVSSELYDLRILNFDTSVADSPPDGEVNILEKWIYRKSRPYYYGRAYQTPLEFDFTVGSFNSIPGAIRNSIESWLVGQMSYQPLRIMQDDISDTVFNVIFTRAPTKYIGNVNFALTLHARCDRPFGIYYPPVMSGSFTSASPAVLKTSSFVYNNLSADADYNRPEVSFTMNSNGGSFSLTNLSDSSRQFLFTGLSPLEELTVDNDREIITTSSSALRMTNFNKNFFRLIYGVNNINLSGNITDYSITATFAKKIGA